ncbi:MAG: hypothetical protein HXY53_00880 [Nitrospirae bacterium]|nr:hypothetical protein [Nitrospirota bacterium]
MKKEMIPELISEIKDELLLLDKLANDIIETADKIPPSNPEKKIYEESLALKLHNFYTGYERIFQKIADELNVGVPHSWDWHKRLLKSMSLEIENIRPPVISKDTSKLLEEYLAFRHVIRNIYGFEIDSERLTSLVEKIYGTHERLREEINSFIRFLKKLVE